MTRALLHTPKSSFITVFFGRRYPIEHLYRTTYSIFYYYSRDLYIPYTTTWPPSSQKRIEYGSLSTLWTFSVQWWMRMVYILYTTWMEVG